MGTSKMAKAPAKKTAKKKAPVKKTVKAAPAKKSAKKAAPAKKSAKKTAKKTTAKKGEKKDKVKRPPSAYNLFMKSELPKVKKANPKLDHKQAFAKAAGNWKNAKK